MNTKRKPVRLRPAQQLRVLRRLLRKARAELAEQTIWADEYCATADELHQENERLRRQLAAARRERSPRPPHPPSTRRMWLLP